MSQSGSTTRISIEANKGVTGALFGIAITSYIARTYIRAYVLKQFYAEDYWLLLAAICLCAATGLAYTTLQYQYSALQIIIHGADSFGAQGNLLPELLSKIPKIAKEENSASMLWWFVIFPVKMAYLLFFRRLIIRIHNLNVWWWCVVAFTVPAGLACVFADWLTCPYFTLQGVLSCSGPSRTYITTRDTTITTVFDVITDILVVSFPAALLWRVQLDVRQKFGLGFSLCLSLVMAMIAIVRISGIKTGNGAIDIVWLAFWQQQECSIALTMVSVSAFRSFFVATAAADPPPRRLRYSPHYWRRRLMRRPPSSDNHDEERTNGLPQIPRATLTGMTTVIRDTSKSATRSDGRSSEGDQGEGQQ